MMFLGKPSSPTHIGCNIHNITSIGISIHMSIGTGIGIRISIRICIHIHIHIRIPQNLNKRGAVLFSMFLIFFRNNH